MAAALTAAAELNRQHNGGSMSGFHEIAAIPEYLATKGHLYKLFAPNTSTKGVYRTIVGLLGRSKLRPAWLAKLVVLYWGFPVAASVGAAPGIASLVAITRTVAETPAWLLAIAYFLAASTTLLGSVIAAVSALFLNLTGKLPKDFYGMVTGVDDADRLSLDALSTWLHSALSVTAGLDSTTPLTFGMLWNATSSPADAGEVHERKTAATADINLEMITTNVTWGRPFNFPVQTSKFFFDQAELRNFFPDDVVDWLIAHARSRGTRKSMRDSLNMHPAFRCRRWPIFRSLSRLA